MSPKQALVPGKLEDRLEFETLLADLSSRFVNLPPEDVYGEIEHVQRTISEFLGFDLSALWERPTSSEGPLTLTLFYRAQVELEAPEIGMNAGEFFPWLQAEMLAGRSVSVSSLDELPAAAAIDCENLRRFGVKSNLTMPLSVGGAPPIGALGFNTTRAERQWPEALVKRLQLVTEVFTNALARKRHEAEAADRLRFEMLLSDLSSRFVNLPPIEVDGEILHAQRRVCDCLDLDLTTLWEWAPDGPPALTMTHVHRSLEGPPIPAAMDARESFPWCMGELLAGRTIALSNVESAPPEAARDLEGWRHFGLKSVLTVPLVTGGGPPLGAFNINSIRTRRDWPDALVSRLQLVAQIFANALARKRADVALRESEDRLSLAAEAAGAGLWGLDLSSRAFWATGRARAIFGYSPDETITLERFEASVLPDDWPRVHNAIEGSVQGGGPMHVDYRILLPDGSERWISSRGRPRFGPGGEPERLMGVSIDITDRKLGEEALRASEARLEAGANLAGLGFYEVDFGAGTAYVDERMREILGVPPDREQGLGPLQF